MSYIIGSNIAYGHSLSSKGGHPYAPGTEVSADEIHITKRGGDYYISFDNHTFSNVEDVVASWYSGTINPDDLMTYGLGYWNQYPFGDWRISFNNDGLIEDFSVTTGQSGPNSYSTYSGYFNNRWPNEKGYSNYTELPDVFLPFYDGETDPINPGDTEPDNPSGGGEIDPTDKSIRIVSPSEFPVADWASPVREVVSFVEEYDAEGNLIQTFTPSDYLQNWTLQANSESGFVGKISSYSLELNLLKMDDNITPPEVGHYVKVYVGIKKNNVETYIPYPRMWVFESAEIDKKQYHLQCYDDLVLIRWGSKTFQDFPHDLDLGSELNAMFALYNIQTAKDGNFKTNHEAWASAGSTVAQRMNYDPDTPIIQIIEDWLEVNGCNGYMGYDDKFHIKRPNTPSTLSNNMVNSISIGQPFHVSGLASVTTLGENIIYGTETGTVISFVDNGLINNHPNIDGIMDCLISDDEWVRLMDWYDQHNVEAVTRGHVNITPFHICSYDGDIFQHANYTIVYDGGVRENMKWEYPEQEKYDFNAPSLDTVLQNTSARVDKVNQEIELNVSKITDLDERVSSFLVTLDAITSTVERIDRREVTVTDRTDKEIEELKRLTSLIQTPEQIQILIEQGVKNSVTEVTTTTGYTFNSEGLNITKSGSNISTIINNDGMRVLEQPGNVTMLSADHNGVDATNLTANNYLQIAHSRFQEYSCNGDSHRTGLFYWRGKDR